MSKIVSANRLRDGVVVYLGRAGWVDSIDTAHIFVDGEIELGLAAARLAESENIVVDAFAVPLEPGEPRPVPVSLRDAIRAKGPTIDYLPAASAQER